MKVKANMAFCSLGESKKAIYTAVKCKSLRFGRGSTSGKSWDQCVPVMDMDGQPITHGWIDTTWGHWVYFSVEGQMYKFDTTKYKVA